MPAFLRVTSSEATQLLLMQLRALKYHGQDIPASERLDFELESAAIFERLAEERALKVEGVWL